MSTNSIARTVGVAALLLGSALAAGCSDDTTNNMAPPDFAMMQKSPDLAMQQQMMDGGTTNMGDMAEMPDADCFNNPMTHIQIINACTTSMRVAKPTNPNLPFVNGMLPPLP